MPAGSRRPSLEQLITTHQSTLETIIKTPKRQQGADSEEAKAGINAIYELIGKEEPGVSIPWRLYCYRSSGCCCRSRGGNAR